jgi:hypothetical protein
MIQRMIYFFETPRFDLFIGDRCQKIETVITLWLVLNFRYCCIGVPEEIMDIGYKADFFKHVGSVLEKYSDDVTSPCNYVCENYWLALPVLKKNRKKDKKC